MTRGQVPREKQMRQGHRAGNGMFREVVEHSTGRLDETEYLCDVTQPVDPDDF